MSLSKQNSITVSIAEQQPITIIKASHGWVNLGLGELWQYRELLFFLTWRDIKVRYKQTVIGIGWAILQPVLSMVVFSVFFGGLAGIKPDSGIPYPVFSLTALVPWTLFSEGLARSGNSLIASTNLLKKIYFPRLIIPLSAILSAMVDFVLSFIVLIVIIIFYLVIQTSTSNTQALFDSVSFIQTVSIGSNIQISWNIIWLPLFVLLALMASFGMGLWLSAMNVQFRDVKYVIPFLIQIWLFITPIVYPSSLIQNPTLRLIYGINPMTGVIEGFRWALLGSDTQPGPIILVSTLTTVVLLVGGMFYFRRMEKTFADVV